MPALNNDDARVTDEELRLLMLRAPVGKKSAIDVHFWYRNLFLLSLSIFDTVVLQFFPEEIFQAFNTLGAPPGLALYLLMVGWFGVMVAVLYGYSYLMDWQFERISMICFAVLLTSFCRDLFYIVSLNIPFQPVVIVTGLLRLVGIAFLFVNAVHAKKAPPLHQRLWPRPDD